MKARRIPRRLAAPAAVLACLAVTGCGYTLTMLPPGVKSVYVPAIVNKCGRPMIEAETTRSLIQEIQRDGSLKVVSADRADAILTVTVVDYKLEPLRYDPQNTKTTVEYRLKLVAEVEFKRVPANDILRKTGRYVAKHSLHMQGGAADIRIPGFNLRRLWNVCMKLQAGGVGYYPKSDFVHVDIGDVRYW